MIRKTFALASLMATALFAAQVSAALIQTDPNGLAFQARYATATSGFHEISNDGTEINSVVYTPPNPGRGGSVTWIAGPTVGTGNEIDTDLSDGLQSYAEYTVRFTSQGTYSVHWAGQRTASNQLLGEGDATGSNNSMWVGPVDQDHTATTGWNNVGIDPGGVSFRDTGVDWVIDGTNVNQDLTFSLGLREDGPYYDRVAFVLEGSGVGPGGIHVIPEPTSIVLLGFATIGICCFRSRFAKR